MQPYRSSSSFSCQCRTHGYLKFLLERRPTKEMTDNQLAELAPWSQKLQSIKNCM
ncbi:transposase domain-containing protein [Roseburia sp. 1XD42-69]|nr:transposase domain-containing protein [Roseburia sp. 1XD42-69]